MRDLDDPIQRGVEDLLAPRRDFVIGQQEGRWRAPLAESPLFGAAEVAEFRYEQRFTADDLCDRVASTSFVAAMRPVDREELLVQIRALTHGVDEPFPFPYVTEVHLIPRTSDACARRAGYLDRGIARAERLFYNESGKGERTLAASVRSVRETSGRTARHRRRQLGSLKGSVAVPCAWVSTT